MLTCGAPPLPAAPPTPAPRRHLAPQPGCGPVSQAETAPARLAPRPGVVRSRPTPLLRTHPWASPLPRLPAAPRSQARPASQAHRLTAPLPPPHPRPGPLGSSGSRSSRDRRGPPPQPPNPRSAGRETARARFHGWRGVGPPGDPACSAALRRPRRLARTAAAPPPRGDCEATGGQLSQRKEAEGAKGFVMLEGAPASNLAFNPSPTHVQSSLCPAHPSTSSLSSAALRARLLSSSSSPRMRDNASAASLSLARACARSVASVRSTLRWACPRVTEATF